MPEKYFNHDNGSNMFDSSMHSTIQENNQEVRTINVDEDENAQQSSLLELALVRISVMNLRAQRIDAANLS